MPLNPSVFHKMRIGTSLVVTYEDREPGGSEQTVTVSSGGTDFPESLSTCSVLSPGPGGLAHDLCFDLVEEPSGPPRGLSHLLQATQPDLSLPRIHPVGTGLPVWTHSPRAGELAGKQKQSPVPWALAF